MEDTIHTNLTTNDIRLMAQIIDICAKRGSFSSDEFIPVGNLVTKLNLIISNVTAESVEEVQETSKIKKNKTKSYVNAEQFEFPKL